MIPTRRIFEVCIFIVVTIVAAMAFHAWLASHDDQFRLQATLATQKQQLDAANDRERDRAATLNQTLAEIEKLKRETQTPQQILRDLPQYLKLPQHITLDSPANVGQADELLQKGGKGTGATGDPADAERSDSAAEAGPASTGSGSILSRIEEALERKTKANPTAAGDESLPDAANQSRSTPAVAQAVPASSAKSNAEIPTADLKPLYDYVQDCRSCQAQLALAQQNHADDTAKLEALTRERDAAVAAAKGGTFWRRFRRNAEWFAIGAATGATTIIVAAHGHASGGAGTHVQAPTPLTSPPTRQKSH
jgi:hypothetical protein